MATDRIDSFEFVRLQQPPWLVQTQFAAHTRPGANGLTLHDLGIWSEPFACESLATAANISAAYDLYDSYRLLTGRDAVTIVWANIDVVVKNHRYFVLRVEPIDIRKVLLGQGPGGDFGAEIEARWFLQPVSFA